MKMMLTLGTLFIGLSSLARSAESVVVPTGHFTPLYGIEKGQKDFLVKSFRIDVYPVTVAEYELFLSGHPEYQKENIPAAYADQNYLQVKKVAPQSPRTFIPWFAANAYCESKKGRLPSTLEWEYVAAADETQRNANRSAPFVERILAWYSTPENENEVYVIGKGKANYYGVHDLHGLIWEWTGDFNSVMMTSDGRDDGDKKAGLYCGSASIGSSSKEDYAAFVRYSLRSSLNAHFTLSNLGFRCAYDL